MSLLEGTPEVTPDPAFGIIEEYKADSSDKKVDLCPGFYRDENAKPWVLPSVNKVLYYHTIQISRLSNASNDFLGRGFVPSPQERQ